MECDILNMILLLVVISCVSAVPMNKDSIEPKETCGYKSCHETKPGFLNVHIVPHTHDDVGWLKTVDQYYYGSRNNIQKAGVQYILDSVIKELWEDPKRRFIYVETAFFWKWWVRQSAATQTKVHTLVRQGRLQFVGGAWSMNDEAATHYQSTVDQFTWGLSKLNATFGSCGTPHVGWQIDPFGHSREFASLLAMMGYDGLFLGRLDYQDKGARLREKRMEMVWRADDDLGKSSDIFTGALYNTYSPPPGFCFDVLCNDEPIVDDPDSPIYNVESKISVFIDYVQAQARYYRTNNVVITMGGDFTYQDATMWYTNLDKLIRYTNLKAAKDGLNVTLFYSTPDCYLKAVKDAAPTLPTKQDDFFPYASDPNSYWTGYFTSRPTTKYFEREGNSYLQMVKQLQVLAGLEEHNLFVLDELKSAMGVMQHHDAITGTEKQHVTHDYVRLLNQAIDDAMFIVKQAVNKLTLGDATRLAVLELRRCHTNESSCDVSENKDNFIVTLYNPLGWSVTEPIRIPVVEGDYQVYGPDGKTIDTQLVTIPDTVQNIPTRNSKATHEIVFIIQLKPLSYKNLYIKKLKKAKRSADVEDFFKNVIIEDYKRPIIEQLDRNCNENCNLPKISPNSVTVEKKLNSGLPNFYDIYAVQSKKESGGPKDGNDDGYTVEDLERFIIENRRGKGSSRMELPDLGEEGMRMLGDEPKIVERSDNEMVFENEFFKIHYDKTVGIKSYTLPGMAPINVSINMYYYTGAIGDNETPSNRSSGAYIFRPTITEPIDLSLLKTDVVQGDIVTEMRTYLSPNGFINTRMYNNLYYLEVDWVVGPISIEDDIGKEYIIRYETNLINNGEFYTDSNGRSVLKRKLNYRPQWNVTLAEPIAGNYYPVTNEIYIQDDNDRVTVLPDRAEGGSSLLEGVVELMLHRRLLHDDAFGVGEALNETINNEGLVARGTQRMLFMKQDDFNKKTIISYHLKPHLLFSDATNINFNDYLKYNNEFSWLNKNLPNGLHLLTLEPWGDKLLLRLENYLTKSEFSDVEIDLSKLFVNLDIKSVRETMLAANVWVDDYKKWEWGTEKQMGRKREGISNYIDGLTVKLSAKQIRTFIVEYGMK